ncbi:putative GDSL-like Lipase/Acylhydrolase domain protein [Picosynechococcus sp. PCC 7002]|uniref:SGNH/GDSL hydrolase family protein n=1 Tax=Picosynechococcus sp. (strain ATCC 27264 / PCC 7002 / PR-6) TaxID=32049 RepID=UPI00016DC52E|nr:GDSL-type esterase/lipase family protein [Picosynechococcus sp. PCC 7002]ACA98975.1 putative GDSL-like Lipase/Acylhydrolase domain protein [Picosynechococcus sp. PCC 7002]
MFSRGRRRYSSLGRRKKKKSVSPWTILVAVPVVLLGLEVVARLGSGYFEGQDDQLSQEAIAYSLKFVDDDQNVYQGLDNRGELLAQKAIATGYELVGSQESEFFSLNEQGFRDEEPLPVAKPQDEIRVFILGNSTAFGRGDQTNQETIAAFSNNVSKPCQDQRQSPGTYRPDVFPFFPPTRNRLAQLPAKIREGNYRVVNVAVPGYSSGNELAQLALKILPYQPDLIVLLNGYEDLLLPSDQAATEIPKLAEFAKNPDAYFHQYLKESFRNKAEQSALMRAVFALTSPRKANQGGEVFSIRERNTTGLAQQLPNSDAEFQERLGRYQDNLAQMVGLCGAAQIPLLVALQPEITGRPEAQLDPTEAAIRQQLGDNYTEKMTTYYPQFAETLQQLAQDFPNNLEFIDFYRLDNQFPTPTFIDPIHINAAANEVMAEQLYGAIANLPKMQIIPENFFLD